MNPKQVFLSPGEEDNFGRIASIKGFGSFLWLVDKSTELPLQAADLTICICLDHSGGN